MQAVIHISMPRIYEFEGCKFEYYRTKPIGPWPVKKDLDLRARAGKKFYAMLGRFLDLSIEEQEKLRIH